MGDTMFYILMFNTLLMSRENNGYMLPFACLNNKSWKLQNAKHLCKAMAWKVTQHSYAHTQR